MFRVCHKTVLVLLLLVSAAAAQEWVSLGPDGGDVRTFGRDPHAASRILLGTSSGLIFQSLNDGKSWSRYVQLGDARDLVVDHIVFHPRRPGVIYAAAWSVEENSGDIFRSVDNGRTWKPLRDMRGRSVRAFELAPSNPEVMVAGTLDGVYRSLDGGERWHLISPQNHADIRNIESVAIDPRSPDVIYVGTWHLPWKTSDGGLTWVNIKQGMIDDSDVFSIIIDPAQPSTVFASACSGIYKSENGGSLFRKAQGIPFSARRTRVLKQDPADRNTVYAGTTEGLYKTMDGGISWKLMSKPNLIINDILIDPGAPQNLLLATDRSGVLASRDAGATLVASNRGFSHRNVSTLLIDRSDSLRLYAGVLNDKEFGGVFTSSDGGSNWEQMSTGLNGRDIFTLQQTSSGALVAGTNSGVLTFHPANDMAWALRDRVTNMVETPVKGAGKSKRTIKRQVTSRLTARVNDVFIGHDGWYAATSAGIFITNNEGRVWHGGPVLKHSDFISVAASPEVVIAATRRAVVVSHDRGQTWQTSTLPPEVSMLANVTAAPGNRLYLAAREGAYRSEDGGRSWERLTRLPVNLLASIYYDEESQRLMTSSQTSTHLFQSTDFGKTWKRAETGWLLRRVHASRGRLLGTTAFDGIVAHAESVTTQPAVAAGGGNGGTND